MLHWDHGYNKDSLSMRVLRPTRLLKLFESCSWGVAKLARHRPLQVRVLPPQLHWLP